MLHFVMLGIGAVIFALMFAFVAACDRSDARLAWSDADYRRRRIAARMSFKNLHAGRPR